MEQVNMKKDSLRVTVPKTVVAAFEKQGFKIDLATGAAAASEPTPKAQDKTAKAAK